MTLLGRDGLEIQGRRVTTKEKKRRKKINCVSLKFNEKMSLFKPQGIFIPSLTTRQGYVIYPKCKDLYKNAFKKNNLFYGLNLEVAKWASSPL